MDLFPKHGSQHVATSCKAFISFSLRRLTLTAPLEGMGIALSNRAAFVPAVRYLTVSCRICRRRVLMRSIRTSHRTPAYAGGCHSLACFAELGRESSLPRVVAWPSLVTTKLAHSRSGLQICQVNTRSPYVSRNGMVLSMTHMVSGDRDL